MAIIIRPLLNQSTLPGAYRRRLITSVARRWKHSSAPEIDPFSSSSLPLSEQQQSNKAAAPIALIFDTETTTKADFKKPPSDPAQPDLVQLGMMLVDTSTWTMRSQASLLVDLRHGVSIHPGAQDTHGISAGECRQFGIHPNTAAAIFRDMYRNADVIVAHNLVFDAIVMEAALHRSDVTNGGAMIPIGDGDGKQRVCTMRASTDVLKIPGRFGNYKWPSLAEAYAFVTDTELEGGHDALVDAKACLQVFRYLVEKDIVSLDDLKEGDIDRNITSTVVQGVVNDKSDTDKTIISTVEGVVKVDASNTSTDVLIQLTLTSNGFTVSGQTYTMKEKLKSHGGRWDFIRKEWKFSDRTSLRHIQQLAEDIEIVNR